MPGWVITSGDARQFERGAVKSGKEAVVHLVERQFGGATNLLAAKRYRDFDDRQFRNDARYRQGRRTGLRREDLAMERGTRAGMAMRAQQWVRTEFETLGRLWEAGVSVPYPVQQSGPEVMLEYIGDEESAAPRLVQVRGSADEFRDLFNQFVANVSAMARLAIVHGDLSPYNMLVWRGRLVLIDFPQCVDPWVNPDGVALLERDVANVCTFFERRGISTDSAALTSELIGEIFR